MSPSLEPAGFAPGTVDPRAGKATVAYAAAAVKLAQEAKVDAVVGCPHSETAVNRAGVKFSGYAGLVADLTGRPREKVFMMLAARGLRIAHVTLHESVSAALARLSPDLVVATAEATVAAAQRLGVDRPRLGVFGINPHAGEDGLFGDDDECITKPAVARLKQMGIAADGPVGGDLLLSQRKHDFYLAMFHDQGHIPIKLISPFAPRPCCWACRCCSPRRARLRLDIAGKGMADPTGVIETLELLAGAS